MFHAADRVLVAVMTKPRDFALARDEGWYRIPERHAPDYTTDAAILAFYFTTAFKDARWVIHWYAEVRGYELVRRRDLFPNEANHKRADDRYYKMQIGPLIRRAQCRTSTARGWRGPLMLSKRWALQRFLASRKSRISVCWRIWP